MFDVVIVPVFNSKRQLLGITLAFSDITNCKQLEEKLAYTNSQLKRVSEILQATESELYITQMKLAAAYQEIEFLSQDTRSRD